MRNTAEQIEFPLGDELEEPGDSVADTEGEPCAGDPTRCEGETESDWGEASRDLVSTFFADVSRLDLLTRPEEESLGVEIARRRSRILRLLRGRRRVVSEALSEVGRGVVHPDQDFREREALVILRHARRKLDRLPRTQRGRKALRKFVEELGQELERYRQVRDRMMTANVRLVMTLARRYRHPTLTYLDLVQEGVLGLMRAVEKYEPCRGIKFSTYAVWWIWQQISRAADCQGAMIRTPVHWNQFRRKLGRTAHQGEGESDADLLAEAHGLTPERMSAMAQSFQCLSLAAPVGDEDDRTLGDLLPASTADSPEGAMLESDLSYRLTGAVQALPEREAQILRLRFGLNGSRPYTLEEIGQRFGVSRERIRQLEARALKRMRSICDDQGLTDLLH